MSSPSKALRDPLEAIVTEYMRVRGMPTALGAIGAAAESSSGAVDTPKPREHGTSVVLDLLYEQSYHTFKSWTLSALDIFKTELNLLSFPVFVASYLSLVRLNSQGASRFFLAAAKSFRGVFDQELSSMSLVTQQWQLGSDEFLQRNKFIRCALSSKFLIRMSKSTFAALKMYLVSCQLPLMVAVLHESVDYKVCENEGDDYECLVLPGYSFSAPTEPSELCWNSPGRAIVRSQSTSSCYVKVREEPFLSEVVSRAVLPQTVLHSSKRRKLETFSDLESITTSKFEEPSVIFATLANTYGDIICVDVDQALTQVVCGCQDSVIRVYNTKTTTGTRKIREAVQPEILPRSKSFEFANLSTGGVSDRFGATANADRGSVQRDGLISSVGVQPTLELKGHSKSVFGVSQFREAGDDINAYNNRLLLSASADETIRLWDTRIGNCVSRYSSASGPCWGVSFAPHGYFFAACNQNGTASVFATDRVQPLRIMCGHIADVSCCSWAPNLVNFVTGSDDRSVRLWDLRTGKCARVFSSECSTAVVSVAVSPGGDTVTAGCDSGGGNPCWDLGTGRLLATLRSSGATYSVAYNESGNKIIAGGNDNSVNVWNINDVDEASMKNGLVENPFVEPRYNFLTKRCPVYKVGCGLGDIVYGAGPVASGL